MKDPVITRFAEACGATNPLDLRVDLADGGLLAEGTVPMPFSLVGRDDACDVTLTDAEVNPRHAWLQVVAGRLLAVDLGSRNGLTWPGGATGSGWLDVGIAVRIGPFELQLRAPVAQEPSRIPPNYNPLHTDPEIAQVCPTVCLEFRNGKRAKDRWTINRYLTLIGRSPDCKIRLTAEDIVGYHCGLVQTPSGLWVVDLSGRGVVVNGERMRVSPLRHGAELWVGRFLISLQYPTMGTPPVSHPAYLNPVSARPDLPIPNDPEPVVTSPPPVARVTPEDEVELGAEPTHDPDSGMPSSHIMADAFRLWGTKATAVNGPVSHSILVSGSGPTPPVIPIPPLRPHLNSTPLVGPLRELFNSTTEPSEAVVQLLRQLGEIHAQMFVQFQESLVLMVQLFGCLRKDQLPAMQRELARIQELNGELTQLQSELARRAVEVSSPSTPSPRLGPSTQTPVPEGFSVLAHTPDSSALYHWVIERIHTLQKEQQIRWQSIVGMFSGKSAG